MRVALHTFAVLLATLLTACVTSDVTKTELTSESKKSGVLLKINGPSLRATTLQLNPISAPGSDGRSDLEGNLTTPYVFTLDKPKNGYIFTTLKPGKYVVKSFGQQNLWALCYKDDSLAFEVKPQSVTYLGSYLPLADALLLQNTARRFRHTSSLNGAFYHYFEDIPAPKIKQATQSDLALAETYIQEYAPDINVPVVLTSLDAAKFKTGKTLIGQKICNRGYYGKS